MRNVERPPWSLFWAFAGTAQGRPFKNYKFPELSALALQNPTSRVPAEHVLRLVVRALDIEGVQPSLSLADNTTPTHTPHPSTI